MSLFNVFNVAGSAPGMNGAESRKAASMRLRASTKFGYARLAAIVGATPPGERTKSSSFIVRGG